LEGFTLTWLIIIGIMVMALAPLWHFMPSKRQRHQATLRETAALNGLFVEFRDLPLPAARLARMPAAERQVLYYGCRLRPSRAAPSERHTWFRDADSWVALKGRLPVPDLASKLPDSVLALESGRASCGVYWRENGGEAEVLSLAETLCSWRDELSPPRAAGP
jgi:hypothetical protein